MLINIHRLEPNDRSVYWKVNQRVREGIHEMKSLTVSKICAFLNRSNVEYLAILFQVVSLEPLWSTR